MQTPPDTKRRPRENSFGWLVNALARRLDAALRHELGALGLDLASFATLMTLFDEEGLAQAELAAAVGVASYSTTRTLDRLENDGLVERRPNPTSRRAHQVFLTEAGRALKPDLVAIVAKVNRGVLVSLPASDRKRVVALLQRVERATRDTVER